MIYFILNTAANVVKIGVSNDPEKRLASLQTAHHSPLELLGTMVGGLSEELELHRHFDHLRIKGEWFRCDPSLMEEIKLLVRPRPKPALFGRRIRSVYLAGKITRDCWRDWILGFDSFTDEAHCDWFAESCVPVPGTRFRLDYLGPYWLDRWSGRVIGHWNDSEHAYGEEYSKHEGTYRTDQNLVREKCALGVEKADLVFAWIDNLSCFGTLAEISMAYARKRLSSDGPVIAISLCSESLRDKEYDVERLREMWFVLGMADIEIVSSSPGGAWKRLWDDAYHVLLSPSSDPSATKQNDPARGGTPGRA